MRGGVQVDEPKGVASSGRTQTAVANPNLVAPVPADVLHARSPHIPGVPTLLNGGGTSLGGTTTSLEGDIALLRAGGLVPAPAMAAVGLAGTPGEGTGVPGPSEVLQRQQSWVQQRVSRTASGALPGDQGSGNGPPEQAGPRTDGLLPGVDTTVEGFETSLLPTVRPLFVN